jgi:murein DD-endopeptidase MepM/ murein hydrolase activator NlpD
LIDPIAQFRKQRFDDSELDFADPIHIEELDSGDNDPFHEDETRPQRWLITTCLAGVAGSLVIGASVLGVFSDPEKTSAHASTGITERWQRPNVAAKSDLNGQFAKTLQLRPYREVAVASVSGSNSTTITNTVIRSQNSGPQVLKMPGLTNASLTGTGVQQPTIIDGRVQLASLSGGNIPLNNQAKSNNTVILKQLPPEPVDEIVVLKRGDNLISRLVDLGVTKEAASRLVAKLEPIYPTKLLKAGQKFVVTLDKQQDFFGNFVIYPVELTFSPGPKEEISIESDEDGKFYARVNGKKDRKPSRYAAPRTDQFRIAGRVTSSLFAAAVDKGVPEYITNQVIRAFSHDVDFQRDVKAGAKFEIYFGRPLSGSSTRRKVVHFAAIEIGGRMKKLYRFTNRRGNTSYYDSKGRGATKFLMRTPISGARISSGYGMRRHPVLGYSKMHTGIDFAAARGTPIRAAGSGTIVYRGWKGGYGRFVAIKHSNGYITRYAHMSKLARGLSKGSHVRQGQVIGYVGSSGRVTGAHLHYEVKINNRFVNPRRVRVAGKLRLAGKDLARFNKHRARVIALMKKLPTTKRVAAIIK